MSEQRIKNSKSFRVEAYLAALLLSALSLLPLTPVQAEALPDPSCSAFVAHPYLRTQEALFFADLPEGYQEQFESVLFQLLSDGGQGAQPALLRNGVVQGVVSEPELALATLWLMGHPRAKLRALVQPLLENFTTGVSKGSLSVEDLRERARTNFKVAMLVGDKASSNKIADMMYERIPFGRNTIDMLAELKRDDVLLELGMRLHATGMERMQMAPDAIRFWELASYALSRVRHASFVDTARRQLWEMASAIDDKEFHDNLVKAFLTRASVPLSSDYSAVGLAAIEGMGDRVIATRGESGEVQWDFKFSERPQNLQILRMSRLGARLVWILDGSNGASFSQFRKTLTATHFSEAPQYCWEELFLKRGEQVVWPHRRADLYFWAFDLFFDSANKERGATVLNAAISVLGSNEIYRSRVPELLRRVLLLNDTAVRQALTAKLHSLGWTAELDTFSRMEQNDTRARNSHFAMLLDVPPSITVALRAVEAPLNPSPPTDPNPLAHYHALISKALRE